MDIPHKKDYLMMDVDGEDTSTEFSQLVHNLRPSGGPSSLPSEHNENCNVALSDFITKGSIDIGMLLHNDPEEQREGAIICIEKSDMNLKCDIPHKSGNRFFASFEGGSVFMNQKGFAKTALSLGCNLFGGLSLLAKFNTGDGLYSLSYGTGYETKSSSTKAMIHYPSQVRSKMEPTIMSIYNSTNLNESVSSELNIGLSTLQKTKPSFSSFRIGLTTTISKSSLPMMKLYLDVFERCPLKFNYEGKLDGYNKYFEKSSVDLAIGVGGDSLELKALLCRSLEQFNRFSIGVGHSTWQGVSWIFRYEKGDLCLNVPIRISNVAKLGWNADTLMHSISTAYLSLLSATIHAIIGEMTQSDKRASSSNDLKKEIAMLSSAKARDHAKAQITLMTRKADTNRRTEESKGGLVVLNATYSVTGGECLDVTIPLQFWVAESKLVLAAHSFSNMLGFYDVRNSNVSNSEPERYGKTLQDMWKTVLFGGRQKEIHSPILYVRYKFSGKMYEICVQDDQGLVLPNPRALEVKEKKK